MYQITTKVKDNAKGKNSRFLDEKVSKSWDKFQFFLKFDKWLDALDHDWLHYRIYDPISEVSKSTLYTILEKYTQASTKIETKKNLKRKVIIAEIEGKKAVLYW